MTTLARNIVLIVALAMLAGCKMERGVTIDFANPVFDVRCGPVALIAFSDQTVLHIGSTYLMLRLPFYVPLIAGILLSLVVWITTLRRRHGQAR